MGDIFFVGVTVTEECFERDCGEFGLVVGKWCWIGSNMYIYCAHKDERG